MLALPLLLAAPVAAAEFAPFHRFQWQDWAPKDGLPNAHVRAVLQTRDGPLWVATDSGLARFDGSEFEDLTSVANLAVQTKQFRALAQAPDGSIWVGAAHDVARYADGRFRRVPMPDLDDPAASIEAIATLGEDMVCVATASVLCGNAGGLHRLGEWEGPATALLSSERGIWIGGQGRLMLRDRDGILETYELPRIGSAPPTVTALAEYDRALWIGTDQGLLHLADGRFGAARLEDEQPPVNALEADSRGELWVATDAMLYRFHRRDIVERIENGRPNHFGWVRAMQATADGGIWLGSLQSGLRYAWHAGVERLNHLDGLHNVELWSYWNDGDELLVGSKDGVSVLRGERFHTLLSGDRLPDPNAYSLLRDGSGRLLVGTRKGLARFDTGMQTDIEFEALRGLQINGLLDEPGYGIWAATNGGLYLIEGDVARRVGHDRGLEGERIRYVLRTAAGTLWVGSETGLYYEQDGEFRLVDGDGPRDVYITAMTELESGALVVGTYNQGLYVLQHGAWRLYTSRNGLPADSVFFLAEVDERLIVSHSNGVYGLLTEDLLSPRLSVPRLHNLMTHRRAYESRSELRCCNGAGIGKGIVWNDMIWLPTLDGAMRMPRDLQPRPDPAARVVGIWVHDTLLDPADPVLLGATQRDPEIRYAAVDFQDAARLRYRYRMRGYSDRWIGASARRSAFYTNLPPGTMHFEVQARREGEAWGPTTSVEIRVQHMLTENDWFRALLAALFAGLLIAAWRSRKVLRLSNESLIARTTKQMQAEIESIEAASEQFKREDGDEERRGDLLQSIDQSTRQVHRLLDQLRYAFATKSRRTRR